MNVPRVAKDLHTKVLRLLDMEYKPAELAAELNTEVRLIRDCVKAGCPARHDKTGHAWINGKDFKLWVMTNTPQRKGKTVKRADNEFYCLACRRYYIITETTRTVKRGRAVVVYAVASCGHNVARARVQSAKDEK